MSSLGSAPALCAKACGFYGSSAKRNLCLCSKCYQVVLKQEFALCESYTKSIAASLRELSLRKENHQDGVSDDGFVAKKKACRCSCCDKKIGLLGFACRCGGKFCNMHRYPETHMCFFDYQALGRASLARENPFVGRDKLGERSCQCCSYFRRTRRLEDIKPLGPPLDDGNAESVSSVLNEPVSAESTDPSHLFPSLLNSTRLDSLRTIDFRL
ncbi:hypothetical protein ACET3Z_023899 [Daucus carota]